MGRTALPKTAKTPVDRSTSQRLLQQDIPCGGLEQRLFDALGQQTATNEILRALCCSPCDAQSVFDRIAESAARLCGGAFCCVFQFDGEVLRFVAHHGLSAAGVEAAGRAYPVAPAREYAAGRAILNRAVEQSPDLRADPHLAQDTLSTAMNVRSIVAVPVMQNGRSVGALVVARTAPGVFSDRFVALLEVFADQAVIAIENVRLSEEAKARTRDLRESIEYQTAVSNVLDAISRSPAQIAPVLTVIVETAATLCGADFAFAYKLGEGQFHLAATNNAEAEFVKYLLSRPAVPGRSTVLGRVILERRTVHVDDVLADPEYTDSGRQQAGKYRTVLGVPLLREQEVIGVIVLVHGKVKPFTQKQIDLVSIFANQAVIAIENVRLFTEVQSRTEELSDALQQQTATAEVLKVISRATFDLGAVLDTLVQSVARLCEAEHASITRQIGIGYYEVASFGYNAAFNAYIKNYAHEPGRGTVVGRALLEGKVVQIADVLADAEYTLFEGQRLGGFRTVLGVPLVRQGHPIGVIVLTRSVVRPFTDKQVELVTIFADQAVIAIENVRLFEEVQTRTAELEESLEYQTAMSDVLGVISKSPADIQPVLDAIVKTAADLCSAEFAFIAKPVDGRCHLIAANNVDLAHIQFMQRYPAPINRDSVLGRVALDLHTFHVTDVLLDPEFKRLDWQKVGKQRTVLGVPLMRDQILLGVIILARTEVKPFTERQVDLVSTFADQAVIAIENVRLFEEVRARTQELARSVEELQALGDVSQAVNSTLDLQTVLSTIVARAVQLSSSDAGAIYVFSNHRRKFRLRATYGMSEELIEEIGRQNIGAGESYIGRATELREAVQVADLDLEPSSPMRNLVLKAGYRGLLVVPLLQPGSIVGALVVRRREPGLFPDHTIGLLQTFAAQSVLAIKNARLYSEVETKSREIEAASRHKSQFLANMSHELRTPLNAVLGFTEMMADGLYGQLPDKALQVLDRVQANGKHLLGLINDVLDLSKIEAGQLTLALENYAISQVVETVVSGAESLARAKGITLTAQVQSELPLGYADDRRLTQVLLNLVGNAIKFTDQGSVDIVVSASETAFEITVHDTGPGIAAVDQERIFEEFQQVDSSSTRAKGGSGLGLAISKQLIEMHGGTLTVESILGQGSTFRIIVPIRAIERIEAT